MVNLIAIAVGFYTAFVGALYFVQRGLMYYPTDHLPPPAASGVAEMRVISVATEDGLALTSWYRPAAPGRPTLIYFHGNGGVIAGRGYKVRPYLDAGYGVLMAEYRGYGGNPGKPHEQGLYADGRANLLFLSDEGVSPGRWVLYGESLGTGVAVQMAAEYAATGPVGALVLESPFESMAEAAAHHYPFVPARLLVKDRFDSASKIASVRAPVLVVHGENDRVIPVAQGKGLFAKARPPKESHWIANAEHNVLHEFGMPKIVLEFVGRHVENSK